MATGKLQRFVLLSTVAKREFPVYGISFHQRLPLFCHSQFSNSVSGLSALVVYVRSHTYLTLYCRGPRNNDYNCSGHVKPLYDDDDRLQVGVGDVKVTVTSL